MGICYLLLGANSGKMVNTLARARNLIVRHTGAIVKSSHLYESEPWGLKEQPVFLNQVLKIGTALTPQQMLQKCRTIEQQLGRVRQKEQHWGQRKIDIDILFFDDSVISSPELTIPHPLLHERRFALIPLCEIAGEVVHPVFHKSCDRLLLECKDISWVRLLRREVKLRTCRSA